MTKMHCSAHGVLVVLVLMLLTILAPLDYAEGKQTAYACEGSVLQLDCEAGKVIHLIRAIYGRFSITICNENGYTEWSVNCGSSQSIHVLNGTCNYQRTCSVMASTKTFGDPCPGTVKYLEVQYECLLANSLTSTTPRSMTGPKPGPPWLPGLGGSDVKITTILPGRGGDTSNSDSKSSFPFGGEGKSNNVTTTTIVSPVHSNNPSGSVNGKVKANGANPGTISTGSDKTVAQQQPAVTVPNVIDGGSRLSGGSASSNFSSPIEIPVNPPSINSDSESEEYDEEVLGEGDQDGNAVDPKGFQWPPDGMIDGGGEVTEPDWSDPGLMGRPRESSSNSGSSWPVVHDGSSSSSGSRGRGGGGDGDHNYNRNDKPLVAVTPRPVSPTWTREEQQQRPYIGVNETRGKGGSEKKTHPDEVDRRRYCEAKNDRGMFWNWTAVNDTVQQPCPGGATGLARWKCVEQHKSKLPMWFPDSPDLSDCKSAWLLNLQARVLEGDVIANVANDLAQVTGTKQMYGGDIAAAVKIIKTIATRMSDFLKRVHSPIEKETYASELLQQILDTGSNLLEKSTLDPWRDLSYADQMAIATALLIGLEDNSFLLANVIQGERSVIKTSRNILSAIFAIEAKNVRDINFPLELGGQWSRSGDVLSMPAEALRENSDGGRVRLVCFAYNNLENVLQPFYPSESGGKVELKKLVNSRVISASLNQGRHIQLALPVQLTLRHLWLDNVSNPQCVFWDYTLNAWSDEGCRVVETNRTHTKCQCTHLTNFAILMDHQPAPQHLPTPQVLQIVMYVGSAVVIMCLVFTLIIAHFCIHGKVFQTMILKNLFLSMLIGEIIFVLGIHQTENAYLCTGIAALLHYFALVSILWLFLHGFHLHLIVVEAAESGLSRKLWYYSVSYGSPAIVVLLSFLLDMKSYRSEKMCWIQTSFTLLCFAGPAIVVALAAAAVLFYTSYKVSALINAMPKKPSEDKALYLYAGTWLRGSILILVLLVITWTLRLLHLEYNSLPLAYAASLSLAIEGVAILIFHILKSDDMISKVCDCGKSSESNDTEMSTHSGQGLPGLAGLGGLQNNGGIGIIEACHGNNHHLGPHRMDVPQLLTLTRQHLDLGNHHEGIYSKQLGAVGIHPSPGGISGHTRYAVDGMLGLYSKGPMDTNWTSRSSYSDIRNASLHRVDPVYEEIEKPLSSRASISDLSEDDGHGLYPHDVDIYSKSICGLQRRMGDHYHHAHTHGGKSRKADILRGGEAMNPLLNRSQHLVHQSHYMTKHRAPPDHHHVSLKGLNPDEHNLQNVHMV